MTIIEPPRLSMDECEEIEPQHPTDVVMSCSPDPVLTHDGQTSQACRRCRCGRAVAHVDLCNRPEAVERRAKEQRARDALAARPLGIADIISMAEAGVHPATEDHWYWCRQHERAEHVNDVPWPGTTNQSCIRIGPFMSEREANLLSGVPEASAGSLGMEVED